MAKKQLKVGQRVSWDSSGGKSVGKVVKKVTGQTHVKSHKVAASAQNPEYLVRSDKSGKMAAHKPEELKSAGSGGKSNSAKKPAAKGSPKKTAPTRAAKKPTTRKAAAKKSPSRAGKSSAKRTTRK